MKESGRMIRSTGLESILDSMAEDTKGSGSRIKRMALVLEYGLVVHLTRGSGCKTKGTVRAGINMMTIAPTSATLKMTNTTVKECSSGLMAQSTEESIATIREKAKAFSRGPMVVNT